LIRLAEIVEWLARFPEAVSVGIGKKLLADRGCEDRDASVRQQRRIVVGRLRPRLGARPIGFASACRSSTAADDLPTVGMESHGSPVKHGIAVSIRQTHRDGNHYAI